METGRVANLNFEVPYNFGNYVSGNIKFGGKYRYTNRENDQSANYVKPDRGPVVHQDFARLMVDENLWSGMSVTEICYEVGFKYPSHFSKLFKKQFAVSPKVYKKEKSKLVQ